QCAATGVSDAKQADVFQKVLEIFNALSAQDLLPFVETNLAAFLQCTVQHLNRDVEGFSDPTADNETPGALERFQSSCIEVLSLYVNQYSEDLGPYIQQIIQPVWQLLQTRKHQPRFDPVVVSGLDLLTALARSDHHTMFNNPQLLHSMCVDVAFPNLGLRRSDVETFEFDQEEWIRYHMLKADVSTRVASARNLIGALCANYETQITQEATAHSAHLQQLGAATPAASWRYQAASLSLTSAVAARQSTRSLGVTKVPDTMNMDSIVTQQVTPILTATPAACTSEDFPVHQQIVVCTALHFIAAMPSTP
ncbi:hypothetical protein KIPB_010559, partial [Kipferlia bialata]